MQDLHMLDSETLPLWTICVQPLRYNGSKYYKNAGVLHLVCQIQKSENCEKQPVGNHC